MTNPAFSALNGANVAVTGASGFIGRALVAELCAHGANVTALIRSRHAAPALSALGASPVIVPLMPGPALARALQGQQILFHFAYDMRASGAENLAATTALIDAAERAGTPRLVHASSVVVYDDWPRGTLTEASPISTSTGGPYRQAKMAMEARLMASALSCAILQPTIVWGPGSAMWTVGPIAALRAGGVVLPDPPGLCPAVHVEDVVQAALCAAIAGTLGQERFLINGPQTLSWADLYNAYATHVGTGVVRLEPYADLLARIGTPPTHQPDAAPSAAARISATLRRAVGHARFEAATTLLRSLRPTRGLAQPNPWDLALYAARPVISTDKAQQILGFTPQTTLAAGIATLP